MDIQWAQAQLSATAAAIVQLCRATAAEQARQKPAPWAWSMLEVVNHLLDEEREDFRQRLDLTLHHPTTGWPPIDPEGWVTARAYQQRDWAQSIANFAAERETSLAWLPTLVAPDWSLTRRHPSGIVLRAGDLLASWVAHDLLHLRQLVELRYHTAGLAARPFDVRYAGEW
jgi:hypothetical protein